MKVKFKKRFKAPELAYILLEYTVFEDEKGRNYDQCIVVDSVFPELIGEHYEYGAW